MCNRILILGKLIDVNKQLLFLICKNWINGVAITLLTKLFCKKIILMFTLFKFANLPMTFMLYSCNCK